MYDLVISLGEMCATAMALKELQITPQTYPFDWSAGIIWDKIGACGFLGKIRLIENNFKDAFRLEDFREFKSYEKEHRAVKNIRTGLQYLHDFPFYETVEQSFPNFLERYKRRISRFYNDIQHANSILFVFVIRDNHVLPLEDIKLGYKILSEKFPSQKISFLIMQSVEKFPQNETTSLKVTDNISVVFYKDYAYYPENPGASNSLIIKKVIMNHLGYEWYFFDETITTFGLDGCEKWGRWSNSSDVVIKLCTKFLDKDLKIKFNCRVFYAENRKWQKVKVFCNGTEVAFWDFKKDHKTNTELNIPKAINNQLGDLFFEFLIDTPVSPKEITGNIINDDRKIAIGFESVSICCK